MKYVTTMSKTKIVSCEGTEEDAIEAVKRLNEILDAYSDQKLEEYKERLLANINNTDYLDDEHKRRFKTLMNITA